MASTYGPLVRGRFDPANQIVGDEFWRATNTPDGPATMRVAADRRDSAVRIDVWGPGRDWVIERVPDITGADDGAEAFAPDHPMLAELHRRAPGLRFVRLRSAFDVAVPTVIEQRVTSLEAHRSWRALVRRHGEPAPGRRELRVPPSPKTLARLPDWEWRRIGVELRRSSTARRLASEACRVERAADAGGAAVEQRLRSINGVGPWTAAHVAHLVVGDPDAVPVGDWHLPHHVAYALTGEPRADDARMLELLEPFRPHRARAWRLIVGGTPGPARRAPRGRIHDLMRAEARRR